MIPLHLIDSSIPLSPTLYSPSTLINADDVTPTLARARLSMIEHGNTVPGTVGDSYLSRARLGSVSGVTPDELTGPLQTPSTPGGLMGRLKTFGGKMTNKRPTGELSSSPITGLDSVMEANAVEV
jgi:WD repeat-containing protein 48